MKKTIILILTAAVILCGCAGKKEKPEPRTLDEPDKIIWDTGESKKEFAKTDQEYQEIYKTIKNSWDQSMNPDGQALIVQLLYVNEGSYDYPIVEFQYEKGDAWSRGAANIEGRFYTFFLTEDFAAVSEDGQYLNAAVVVSMDYDQETKELMNKITR